MSVVSKAKKPKRKAAVAADKHKVDVGTVLSYLRLDVEVRSRRMNKVKIVGFIPLLCHILEEARGLV
jgi:hypothetical protein